MSSRFFGSIIGLKPEYTERYRVLHRHVFPGVLDRLSRSNIRNYSIFLRDNILFAHLEYVGDDYEADNAAIAGDQTTREWWTLTDPMQTPLPERAEDDWWARLAVRSAEAHAVAGPELQVAAASGQGSVQSAGSHVRRLAFVAGKGGGGAGARSGQALRLADEGFSLAGGVQVLRVFEASAKLYFYVEVARPVGPELQFGAYGEGDDPRGEAERGSEDAVEDLANEIARALAARFELDQVPAPMEQVFYTDGLGGPRPARKVFVSGCFDMLHSGHVAFLTEAATYGDLHVGIGSDATIHELKGRYTVNSQAERKYMIEALACVTECRVNTGSGFLDFEPDLHELRPDLLIVNEDGHSPAKEALCRRLGIEYLVLRRIPHAGLAPRTTTALRTESRIPFRIDLAGGWLDQPFVSEHHPGPVLTISIEPTIEFNDRSGMASSTRRRAIDLWRTEIPHGDPEQLAKVLFSYENPPGTREVAGSQDALGIVLPGLNRLYYGGGYWPQVIESVQDEETLRWIEERLHLVTLGPRAEAFEVLQDTRVDCAGARALSTAAEDCWTAIARRDARAFGDAFRRSFEAQVAMFPRMMDAEIARAIGQYRDEALGWKLSGAGGGGYLILVAERALPNTVRIKIRRRGGD